MRSSRTRGWTAYQRGGGLYLLLNRERKIVLRFPDRALPRLHLASVKPMQIRPTAYLTLSRMSGAG
jgi:hypothetical protein